MRRQTRTHVRALRSSFLGAMVLGSNVAAVACRGSDPAVDTSSGQYGAPPARDTLRASQSGLRSPFSRLAEAIRGPAAPDTASHR